jgi:hypothetical protein
VLTGATYNETDNEPFAQPGIKEERIISLPVLAIKGQVER